MMLTARRKGGSLSDTVTGYLQPSSDANIARVVFADDGTLESVFVETTELTLR